MHFLFGVRHEKDLFYQDVFQRWSQDDNFSYQLCVSRPLGDEEDFTTGYVTDHITTDYLGLQGLSTDNLEAYICGSPAMVKDAREKLEEL